MRDRPSYLCFPCPICSSPRFKVKYPDTLGAETPCFDYDFGPAHGKTYRIVKCLDCGHGYSSPRPDRLWEHYQATEDLVYLRNQSERMATARKVVQRLLRFIPEGRLLDIGCATGDFLAVAQEHYSVEGLELSKWSADIALSRGFVIHNCELVNLQTEKPYDIITLWGVIEHFENPVAEVESIAKLVRRGGIVCLWTGNFGSSLSKILGKKWWWVQGQHINLFSKKSLRKLFENNGFDVAEIGLYPYVATMQSISRSLGRYALVTKISKHLLNSKLLSRMKFTLRLPGEMFGIFRRR